MRPIKKLQIGKSGLTEQFIGQVKNIFKNETMIKVTLLHSSTRNKVEAIKIAETIIDKLGKNYTFKLIGYTLTLKKWRKPQR